MAKYRNKKITVNGKTFDSKKEYNRYCELRLLEKAGAITDLQTQVKYTLIPAQRGENGKVIERAITYTADFAYRENGEIVAEDVKGYRNPSSAGYAKFVLKRKMMLYFHGIKIKEV